MIFYLAHWDWILYKSRIDIVNKFKENNIVINSISPTDNYREAINESFNTHYEWNIDRRKIIHFSAIINLRKILKKINEDDIIHIFTLKTGIYYVLATLFKHKKYKVIISITGLGYLFSDNSLIKGIKFLIKPILIYLFNKKIDLIIFQNKKDFEKLVKYLKFQNKTKIIRGSGINTNIFQKKNKTFNKNKIKILMCNRLLKDKGVPQFLELANKLNGSKNLTFYLAGEVDLGNPSSFKNDELNKLISESNVIFLGNLEVETKLKDYDILILMSSHEGLPRIALESMYVGLATISNNLPGLNEICDVNDNLYLINNNELESYIKVINDIQEQHLEQKIIYSRKKIENEFSTDVIYKKFKEIYEFVL